MGGVRENAEEQSERTTRNKRKCSEKGKFLPETEDVTRSRSTLTSEMTSEQEVDRVTKRKSKAKEMKEALELYSASSRLKQMSSNYASSMKESTLKSQENKTDVQRTTASEKNDGFTFEFSKRLVALAREKQAENRKRRRSESKSFCRERKGSANGAGSHDNGGLKRKRQRLSQSQSSSEDLKTNFAKMLNYENKLMNEKKMEGQIAKRWRTDALNLAPMDFEFSRRLKDLSIKKQRYHHDEHAHCCRCVQSFECFWPRSNLQTIRRQGFC